MKSYRNEKGFGHVLSIALIAVVIGAVAYVGMKVMDTNTAINGTATSNTPPVASTTVPKSIKTKADLQQAQRALDTTTAPDPNVLNNDIKNLL